MPQEVVLSSVDMARAEKEALSALRERSPEAFGVITRDASLKALFGKHVARKGRLATAAAAATRAESDGLTDKYTRLCVKAAGGCAERLLRTLDLNPTWSPGETCVTCLTLLEGDSTQPLVRLVACRHVHHLACWCRWGMVKQTCPVCRADAGFARCA